jgi:hypothetical protein
MNRKPSRTFVYLALIMVFLLMIGLVVVGVLASSNRPPTEFEQTRLPFAMNETTIFHALQTETAKAPFTPIYYDASMSPTALPYTELHSMTAVAQFTPTPPYDAELYEKRRMEELGLITGGGPTQYAIFYATETALVAAYQTAQHFTATPTATVTLTPSPNFYGFNAALSESGQTAVWLLMTAGGPDDYATFYAEETLFASASQTAQSLTATLTPSPTALPTNTVSGSEVVQCAFSWAHRDLPDVATLAQDALTSAEITYTSIRADAYGEECINFSTNTVVSFGAMTTDFYVTAQLSNLNAPNTLADYVKAVYAVLSDLDRDSLPARLGYLDFTFTSGTTTKYLRTTFDEIKAALDKKLSGQKLLDELGSLR